MAKEKKSKSSCFEKECSFENLELIKILNYQIDSRKFIGCLFSYDCYYQEKQLKMDSLEELD